MLSFEYDFADTVYLWNGTNVRACVCVCIVSRVFGNLYLICTCLQHLYFLKKAAVLQPKHLGAIKSSLHMEINLCMWCFSLFILDMRTKSDYFPIQH